MGDRCTGQCCHRFILSYANTHEEVDAYLRSGPPEDGVQIADMIVLVEVIQNGTVLPMGRVAERDDRGVLYTCKHFDTATRDCGIYETRPSMCRRYPLWPPV